MSRWPIDGWLRIGRRPRRSLVIEVTGTGLYLTGATTEHHPFGGQGQSTPTDLQARDTWAERLSRLRLALPHGAHDIEAILDPSVAPVFTLRSQTRLTARAWESYARRYLSERLGFPSEAVNLKIRITGVNQRLVAAAPRALTDLLARIAPDHRGTVRIEPLVSWAWSRCKALRLREPAQCVIAAGAQAVQTAWIVPGGADLTPPLPRAAFDVDDPLPGALPTIPDGADHSALWVDTPAARDLADHVELPFRIRRLPVGDRATPLH